MTTIERLHTRGIRRIRSGGGFRYVDARGRPVPPATRERIEKLRLPPAWTEVAIHPSPTAPVQAIGRDKAGRWQYVYHERHVERRERRKQERLIQFVRALPRMRRAVARDLATPGIPQHKVLAGILRILSTCFLRPGSAEYARDNGSYGVATLQRRHVHVRGDVVQFDFRGKSGKRQVRELRDRRLAQLIRALLRHPGEVFKYRAEDGTIVDVHTGHINTYLKQVMGRQFSAKDFRTWAANLLCAGALARAAAEADASHDASSRRIRRSPSALRREVAAAMREVAEHLGNTPAVTRASYVFEHVVRCHAAGRHLRIGSHAVGPISDWRRSDLEEAERALVALLQDPAGRRAVAALSPRAAGARAARGTPRRAARRSRPRS